MNSMFGEGQYRNGGKIVPKEIKSIWEADVQRLYGIENKDRVALFNHAWNRDKKKRINAIPKKDAYPLLANIINNYKQEVLNGQA